MAKPRRVKEDIDIELNEIIRAKGIEEFDDLVAERAGYPLMCGIGYEIIGIKKNNHLIIRITGENEW